MNKLKNFESFNKGEQSLVKKRLIKDYTLDFRDYGEITVPKGVTTTNKTASGIDSNYNFVDDFDWIDQNYKNVAAFLKHDIKYYGINVPNEYLETIVE